MRRSESSRVGERHPAEAGDVLIKFYIHHPVVGEGMHAPGGESARNELARRLRLRHLQDEDLMLLQWYLGEKTVEGLSSWANFFKKGCLITGDSPHFM